MEAQNVFLTRYVPRTLSDFPVSRVPPSARLLSDLKA